MLIISVVLWTNYITGMLHNTLYINKLFVA